MALYLYGFRIIVNTANPPNKKLHNISLVRGSSLMNTITKEKKIFLIKFSE